MENYRQFSNHVAHNSFIHSYAEMGLIGGTLFLGAFWFAVKGMYDLRNSGSPQFCGRPGEGMEPPGNRKNFIAGLDLDPQLSWSGTSCAACTRS